MSARTIKFYFDYNSPYSYIASTRIEAIAERRGLELLWLPMVLGALFKANDIQPPHTKARRRTYVFQDLEDLTGYYGIPYRQRTEFLFNPILSLRVTLTVPQGPERARLVHALYRGAFAEDLDLGQPQVVIALLDKAGFDGAQLVEKTKAQPIKDELKTITDEAIAKGMFGAPTFIVDDGKMFWGQDRLALLEHYLDAT